MLYIESGFKGSRKVSIKNRISLFLHVLSTRLICSTFASVRWFIFHWPILGPCQAASVSVCCPPNCNNHVLGLVLHHQPSTAPKLSVEKSDLWSLDFTHKCSQNVGNSKRSEKISETLNSKRFWRRQRNICHHFVGAHILGTHTCHCSWRVSESFLAWGAQSPKPVWHYLYADEPLRVPELPSNITEQLVYTCSFLQDLDCSQHVSQPLFEISVHNCGHDNQKHCFVNYQLESSTHRPPA